jgi:hypothetical protein
MCVTHKYSPTGEIVKELSMRTHQIDTSILKGCSYLSVAYPRFLEERRVGGGGFAVPQLPGHAKRFRPYPTGRRYRRR